MEVAEGEGADGADEVGAVAEGAVVVAGAGVEAVVLDLVVAGTGLPGDLDGVAAATLGAEGAGRRWNA